MERWGLVTYFAEYFYPSDSDTTQTAAVHMTDLNTSLDHISQHASRVGSHKRMALPKALAFEKPMTPYESLAFAWRFVEQTSLTRGR